MLLPAFGEAPPGFPAELLWDFRAASLATQVVLWGTLGATFAAATARTERG